jgi:hypothetical protein
MTDFTITFITAIFSEGKIPSNFNAIVIMEDSTTASYQCDSFYTDGKTHPNMISSSLPSSFITIITISWLHNCIISMLNLPLH